MKRIAIVGGGIAGLAAAYELEKKRLEKELKGRGKKNKRKRGHGIFFGNADDDEFCGTSTE